MQTELPFNHLHHLVWWFVVDHWLFHGCLTRWMVHEVWFDKYIITFISRFYCLLSIRIWIAKCQRTTWPLVFFYVAGFTKYQKWFWLKFWQLTGVECEPTGWLGEKRKRICKIGKVKGKIVFSCVGVCWIRSLFFKLQKNGS